MADVPVIRLEGFLLVSIQEDVTDAEAEDMQHRLLETLASERARGIVIDVSGMDVVDSYFCRVLSDTAAMSRLMGARTAVVGMSPAVAVALTELDLTMPGVHSDLSLERGLEWLRSDSHA